MQPNRHCITQWAPVAAWQNQEEHDGCRYDSENEQSPEYERKDRGVRHGANPPAREVLRSEMLAEKRNRAWPGLFGRVHVGTILPVLCAQESMAGSRKDDRLVGLA